MLNWYSSWKFRLRNRSSLGDSPHNPRFRNPWLWLWLPREPLCCPCLRPGCAFRARQRLVPTTTSKALTLPFYPLQLLMSISLHIRTTNSVSGRPAYAAVVCSSGLAERLASPPASREAVGCQAGSLQRLCSLKECISSGSRDWDDCDHW